MAPIIAQAGCVPFRRVGQRVEVVLVTSRFTGQWIVPKGRVEPGEEARVTALRETGEEAGLRGEVRWALGSFDQPRGHAVARIEAYALEVVEVLDEWPERHERKRAWFELEHALGFVDRPEVRAMLQALAELVGA